jgi:phage tail-like protein
MNVIRRSLAVLISSAALSAVHPAAQVRDDLTFVLAIEGCDTDLGTFSQVTGLDVSFDLAEYRSGGSANADNERWYQPGLTKYGTVTLSRKFTGATEGVARCVEKLIASGEPAAGTIALLDFDGQPIVTWDLQDTFPLNWTVPDTHDGNSVGMETLVLSHEGFVVLCERCSQ